MDTTLKALRVARLVPVVVLDDAADADASRRSLGGRWAARR